MLNNKDYSHRPVVFITDLQMPCRNWSGMIFYSYDTSRNRHISFYGAPARCHSHLSLPFLAHPLLTCSSQGIPLLPAGTIDNSNQTEIVLLTFQRIRTAKMGPHYPIITGFHACDTVGRQHLRISAISDDPGLPGIQG